MDCPSQTDLDIVNNRLKSQFGINSGGGPNFRVVWSSTMLETRYEVDELNPFLKIGRIKLKYMYASDRFVVEKYLDQEPPHEEVVNWDHYEPIFILWDKDGEFLPLNYAVCELIVNFMVKGIKTTISAMEDKERKEILKLKSQYFDFLDDKHPYMTGKIKAGEAIYVP